MRLKKPKVCHASIVCKFDFLFFVHNALRVAKFEKCSSNQF